MNRKFFKKILRIHTRPHANAVMPNASKHRRRSEYDGSGLRSYFKASNASRLNDAVERVLPTGNVNVLGYMDAHLLPRVQKIEDVQVSCFGGTMKVKALSPQALLALIRMESGTHARAFRMNVGDTTRNYRVTFAALSEAIERRCLKLVQAGTPQRAAHRQHSKVNFENRQELGIPDDSEEDFEWLSYRNIPFDTRVRDWSISTSKFGPRSGISDAHRLRRAILLGITNAEEIQGIANLPSLPQPAKHDGDRALE